MENSKNWYVKAIGNITGQIRQQKKQYVLKTGQETPFVPGDFRMLPHGGKFSDSEDSFLYVFCRTDPEKQNFRLQACFDAEETDDEPDQQSGFGIVLADTDQSVHDRARHRNMAFLGVYGRERACGVKLVTGYSGPEAGPPGESRIADQSRRFSSVSGGLPQNRLRLCVEKRDDGLVFTCEEESIFIPGCDFLMKQEPRQISVGFAAARGLSVRVSDIQFEVMPGVSSHTPESVINASPERISMPWALSEEAPSADQLPEGCEIFAAPQGRQGADGTEKDPFSLEAAIACAGPGTTVWLQSGTYNLHAPLVTRAAQSGTPEKPVRVLAREPRKAVLDGSGFSEKAVPLPVILLTSDYWQLQGLVFRNSPSFGLLVSGTCCRVENCEAACCGDTGILVQAAPGTDPADWPSYNEIVNCDSHDNCDVFHTNADGFGVKLRAGPGNVLWGCAAYRNCDDGFDLYAKQGIGSVSPVELDQCLAFDNGRYLKGNDTVVRKYGTGFKLGGENQPVRHEVWRCIAFRNPGSGFSSNSNPTVSLHHCSAYANGKNQRRNFHLYSSLKTDYFTEKLRQKAHVPAELEAITVPPRDKTGELRMPDRIIPHRKADGILFIISSLGGGGAERVLCRLANMLSEKHRVFILYFREKESIYPLKEQITLINEKAPQFTRRPGLFRRIGLKAALFYRIHRIKRDHKIDTTISFMPRPNMMNAMVPGGRRIFSERNDPVRHDKTGRRRNAFSFRVGSYVVFQTEKVRKMNPRAVIKKSGVIPNPAEVSCTALPERRKVIVSAGRYHPQKDQATLLRAFAKFHQIHPEYELRLFGEGELLEDLQALIHELGIEACAHLVPFTLEIHNEIRDAEMFVLSSLYEGLSNALLEAMRMGIACISTACTGSPELLENGRCGLLTPIGDADAICTAMCRLAEDEPLRKKLERLARNRSMGYSPERILRQWERIL